MVQTQNDERSVKVHWPWPEVNHHSNPNRTTAVA